MDLGTKIALIAHAHMQGGGSLEQARELVDSVVADVGDPFDEAGVIAVMHEVSDRAGRLFTGG